MAKDDKQAEEALKLVMQTLSSAMVYTETTNVDTNRKLWNEYDTLRELFYFLRYSSSSSY